MQNFANRLTVNQGEAKENVLLKALQNKLVNWENRNFFEHSFLDENSDQYGPDGYFKAVSHTIDLTQIYKVVDVCYYNIQDNVLPVLVQITNEKIREFYCGYSYLLQIYWLEGSPRKVGQIPLFNPVKKWALCGDTLVYAVQEGDEGADILNIMNVSNLGLSTTKISGISIDENVTGLLYYFKNIYIVKTNQIEVYKLDYDQSNDTENIIDASTLPKQHIDIGLKIHDIFLYNYATTVALESANDNQLDFNYLYIDDDAKDKSGNPEAKYLLVQAALKVKRKTPLPQNDPIKQVFHRLHLIDGETSNSQELASFLFYFQIIKIQFAVAIRESGGFDMYFNMSLIDSNEERNVVGINGTFEFMTIKCQSERTQEEMDSAENGEDEWQIDPNDRSIKYEYRYLKMSKGYFLDMYSSSMQSKDDLQRYYTDYNLEIANKIVKLFSNVNLRGDSLSAIFSHEKYISIFDLQTWEWTSHMEMEDKIKSFFEYNIYDTVYLCALLENDKIFKLDFSETKDFGLPHNVECILDYSGKSEILSYAIDFENKAPLILGLRDRENDTVTIELVASDLNIEENTVILEDFESSFKMLTVNKQREIYLVVQRIGYTTSTLNLIQLTDDYGTVVADSLETLKDVPIGLNLHSCASNNPKKQLILFDYKNTYIVNVAPFKCDVIENTDVRYLINDTTLDIHYGLKGHNKCQAHNSNQLVYLDIDATVKNRKISLLPLANMTLSANHQIALGLDKTRIGFFQSYNEFVITILPNRNYNKFFNDIGTSNYGVYRQIKDRVIVYSTKDGKIYTYDVVTAKLIQVNDSNVDLSEYTQFNPRGFETLIIKKNTVEETQDFNLGDYYPHHMLETSTLNQVSYRQNRCPKTLWRFREIQIRSEKHIEILLEFLYPSQDDQSLNLNTNKDKTLLVARDDMGLFIYNLIPQKGSLVQLQLIRQITEFSPELQRWYRYRLDFFTPNFTKLLSYDPYTKYSGRFLIHDTMTGEVLNTFNTNYLFFENEEKDPNITFNPQMIINTTQWLDEKTIRIVSLDGVEKIVDVDDDFKETAFNQIPLFGEITLPEWKQEYHIILSRKREDDPVKKLQRIYQDYKSLYYLFPSSTKADFYELMMKQDFEQFDLVSHSFTLMSWNIALSLVQGDLKIKDLSENTILTLIYSVFPGGNTIFHLLVDNQDEMFKLLEFCHPECKAIKHHIPFIQNNSRKTALHICIEKKASKAANTLLRYLSLYGSDHHSKAIKDILHTLVELKLGDFDLYMDSRFQQTEKQKKIEKLNINFDSVGFITSSPWINQSELYDNLSDWSQVERKVKVETLDISGIYHYNDPDEDKFFDALANTDQFTYFELKSIQCLIDFNYPIVQKYLIKKLFFPYVAFHILYLVLIFALFESRYEEPWIYFYWGTLSATCLFASYFLLNEMRQISNDGLNYFKSFWNYIDVTPLLGIYAIGVFSVIDAVVHYTAPEDRVSGTIQRIVVSIVTLFMWLKFLYFFRIFDKTSYLIRAVVEVIKTMRHFFLVLLFTVVGFGNAFLVLSLGNNDQEVEGSVFIPDYLGSILFSYRMMLGDFDTGAFGTVAVPLVWGLFLLFTVFNIIVMLNLLIAVISDAYAAVAEISEQAMYQERATMIAENNYLIPIEVRKTYAHQNRLILVVTDLEDEVRATGNDAVLQKVEEVKVLLQDEMKKVHTANAKEIQVVVQNMNDIKMFLLKSMPGEVIQTKIYKNKLTKMTLHQMQLIHEGDYVSGFGCDGRNFTGCQSADKGTRRNDDDEEIYHCSECQSDMCIPCYNQYGEIHNHPMEKLALKEIKARHDGYGDGWGCDCNSFKGCPLDVDRKITEFEIVYHNSEDYFDLCPQCADYYKIVKA